MRPQDIIADFLERIDLTKKSSDDAARDLMDALEKHDMAVRDNWDCDYDDDGDYE